jgi:type II secretory pathway component PulJ
MSRGQSPGFSLIELLIAVGLACFLLMGVWRVYSTFHRTHDRLHSQMTEAIELQLIESLLRHRIRSAGYTPCMPLDRLLTEEPLFANKFTKDSITLNQMDEPVYPVLSLDNQNLILNQHANLDPAKLYLIADCYHAELVRIRTTYKQHVVLLHPLHFNYEQPVYFGSWLSERFFMRYKPKPALMVQHIQTEMLSSEVIAFQVGEINSTGSQLLKIKLQTQSLPTHQLQVRVRAW